MKREFRARCPQVLVCKVGEITPTRAPARGEKRKHSARQRRSGSARRGARREVRERFLRASFHRVSSSKPGTTSTPRAASRLRRASCVPSAEREGERERSVAVSSCGKRVDVTRPLRASETKVLVRVPKVSSSSLGACGLWLCLKQGSVCEAVFVKITGWIFAKTSRVFCVRIFFEKVAPLVCLPELRRVLPKQAARGGPRGADGGESGRRRRARAGPAPRPRRLFFLTNRTLSRESRGLVGNVVGKRERFNIPKDHTFSTKVVRRVDPRPES